MGHLHLRAVSANRAVIWVTTSFFFPAVVICWHTDVGYFPFELLDEFIPHFTPVMQS